MDRFHNFELVVYYSNCIIDDIIKNDKNICHYAYIYHDKDYHPKDTIINGVNVSLQPKEKHYHLLINYKNAKTFNACLTQFTIPSYTTRVIPCLEKNKQDRFEYLTHSNDLDKFQYDKSLIITDNANFWNSVSSSSTEKVCNLIDDIISNKPLRYMLETYGRDYVINYDKYHKFALELRYSLTSSQRCNSSDFIADERTGVIQGVEDNNIQLDILFDSSIKD